MEKFIVAAFMLWPRKRWMRVRQTPESHKPPPTIYHQRHNCKHYQISQSVVQSQEVQDRRHDPRNAQERAVGNHWGIAATM